MPYGARATELSYAFVSWRQRRCLFEMPHNRPITGGVELMHQDVTFIPIRRGGEVRSVCVTVVDATDAAMLQKQTEQGATLLRQAMSDLERLSERDGLTGIYNRRFLERRLDDEFARYVRYGTATSVMMFDLDHFKRVNDRYGHGGGDEVLRVVASRIGAALRDTDTFGRYGGEEFMIILPSTSRAQASAVAERVRASVAVAPIPFGEGAIAATISVGVAEASVLTLTQRDLVERADAALYAAKAGGRNRVEVEALDVPAIPLAHAS